MPIHRRFCQVMLLVAVTGFCGCNGANGNGDKERSMSRSNGKFTQGRKDGLRDAKDSLFDDSGAWMWMWMMDQEYRTGYDQGWNEGKYMRKFKSHQERAKQGTDSSHPAPTPKGD